MFLLKWIIAKIGEPLINIKRRKGEKTEIYKIRNGHGKIAIETGKKITKEFIDLCIDMWPFLGN